MIIIISINMWHIKNEDLFERKKYFFLFTMKNNDGLLWHRDRFSDHDNMSDNNEPSKVPQTSIEREYRRCLSPQSLNFVSSILLLRLAFFWSESVIVDGWGWWLMAKKIQTSPIWLSSWARPWILDIPVRFIGIEISWLRIDKTLDNKQGRSQEQHPR
jgi:hypothetical protein